jgi:hypothetical protein
MISSVVGPGPALPTNLASRLGGRVPSARSMMMLPSVARLKATSVPGSNPKQSRTRLGTVTRPLLVTLVVIAASVMLRPVNTAIISKIVAGVDG